MQAGKAYQLKEAAEILKGMVFTKFDSTVEINMRLGVDPKNADQMVRGTVSLPNGSGKELKVLVLCNPDKEEEAKAAGADFVGLEEFIPKIEKGWTDMDVVVAQPSVMGTIGKLGKVLGPRNLMPNPKSGTVTDDIAKVVAEIKKGKISFKVDKDGIVASGIGKASFSAEQIEQNAMEFINTISKMKPASVKGTYIKTVYLSGTMSPSVLIDHKEMLSSK